MTHPYLDLLKPSVKSLANVLGPRAELILHDLSHPENSAIMVVGNITGRKKGAPITNIVLRVLKLYGDKAEDMINYRSMTKDGRVLKSSTLFIRDENSKIIGSLCINIDLTDYMYCQKVIQDLCQTTELETNINNGASELFAQDINEVVETLIIHELEHINKPVPLMQKEDKLKIVQLLEEKGIFDVKGSVDLLAKFLGVSPYTIYNYLKEVRFSKTNY